MRHRYHTLLLLCAAAALVLAGCDQSSQKASPENVNRYIITQNSSASGDAATGSFSDANTVNVPDTVDYYMQGYTVNKDYTWTVNGSSDFPVAASSDQTYEWQSRGGEFITVVYGPGDPIATTSGMSASTNSIKVNASNDNINAETIDVSAAVTDNLSGQIGRFGAFSTLTSLAASSGIADVLSQEGPSFTLFAPSEAAFAALENVPTQATDGDEDATTSVRADILKYHAIQGDSLTASDLPANGVETLLGSETVSVTAEMVSQANIPATNGVIHKLDGAPLLPPTASVDFTDRTVADTTVTQDAPDDSLTVDGSYFPEEGGYILLYDDSGSVVGESKYISGPGVSNEVKVGLEENFSSGTGPITLVAIPHRENSGNESFDGDSSDPPYQLDGSDVTDEAVIDVESTD
ncbi:fasciclin domain-containing protein [Salinibacter ruber]|uniref:fasciclin domain-containing protein n=1 Tax=Salinibacter ruber TaxID=146919 RepID=UPI002168F91C|nr:fasciclin domain-containing protein [Salinibacter ruber]MCS3657555.1 putative surface protein with fasciclin (FAS1) repeats [Salinibacter ruber]MCS4186763.1 putative surface protein with fasciclin (FAS1) repeats [Salinibacter ruber]